MNQVLLQLEVSFIFGFHDSGIFQFSIAIFAVADKADHGITILGNDDIFRSAICCFFALAKRERFKILLIYDTGICFLP